MLNKRRIGLGITGLANAMDFLGIRYGSAEAIGFTEQVMKTLMIAAYTESASIAEEKGSFPLWSMSEWGKGSPVVAQLPQELKDRIHRTGIRNGVILTIAPTGTTSLYYGNISSGLEPVFAHTAQRRVRTNNDDTYEVYEANDYGYNLWRAIKGEVPLPGHMVTAQTLDVADHVRIQSACQAYVDASISKTINCPPDMSFEAFELVYLDAYNSGCKGCTTYRPSEVRGSILSVGEAPRDESREKPLPPRPDILSGSTYKVKWPSAPSAFYVTINDDGDRNPFEIFITSTNAQFNDWTTALSLMISAIMRKGGDISFIPEELKKVHSAKDAHMIRGKFYGSLVARIAECIELHIQRDTAAPQAPMKILTQQGAMLGEYCPSCGNPTMYPMEGCMTCTSCSFSKCG